MDVDQLGSEIGIRRRGGYPDLGTHWTGDLHRGAQRTTCVSEDVGSGRHVALLDWTAPDAARRHEHPAPARRHRVMGVESVGVRRAVDWLIGGEPATSVEIPRC